MTNVEGGAEMKPRCDSALVPMGSGDIQQCIRPDRHGGEHTDAQGYRWADPEDDRD